MNRPTPILLWEDGRPELWLCILVDGAWKPVGQTGPIRMPSDWMHAILDAKEKL